MVGWVAPAVIRQIDLNDVLEALDVDAIAARLDLDALIARMDLDAVAARLDLDTLIARMDLDAVAGQLDLEALIARLDLVKLTTGASQDVAVSGLDLVRRQIVRADATVDRTVSRVLRRRPGSRPEAPPRLDRPAAPVDGSAAVGGLQRRAVSGHYAGPVTRALSVIADVASVVFLNAAFVATVLFFFDALTNNDSTPRGTGIFTLASLAVLYLAWFWLPVGFFGRTPAMALLGVAVVRRDGGVAGSTRALVRALVLPVSLLFPILFLGLVVGKERRTLHDAVAGTVVVYDWGAREAEQPVTIRDQLSARVRRSSSDRAPQDAA